MSFSPAAVDQIIARISPFFDSEKIKTDPLYTFAYSSDASYFRLVPKMVVIADNETQIRELFAAASSAEIPITFRAAGTSLSGQAVGEGIVCVLGDGWRHIDISEDRTQVTLGPATIVADANKALRPFAKKIGPDPASQATAKVGGVVNNNSSGMCCGVVQNTYHTMAGLRLILKDGTVLDTRDPKSRQDFLQTRPDMIAALENLRDDVRRDNELVTLIHKKYKIKNTVGYGINALVDHDDPINILSHLMVGSEGTLGFVSEITYNTVPDHPHKATALIPFADNFIAAKAIQALRDVGVSAAEFMERKALATVEHMPAIQPTLPHLTDISPAVLVEIMAENDEELASEIEAATKTLEQVGTLAKPDFTTNPVEQLALWDVRKGLFASAGATRKNGTVMLTEDVAVPLEKLPEAVAELRELLDKHGFSHAIIFGHTLAGNLHFQMDADFTDPAMMQAFEAFSAELAQLISLTYEGSLKAEHGTGRAIAPFVKQEWGEKAYRVMQDIKQIFDDTNLLNPGVLINEDEQIHLKNTKQMGAADPLIDLCIECGFCEPACPSAGLTLSPRQRITTTRERERLRKSGEDPDLLAELDAQFVHAGMDTCAACNLCSTRCPVGIETGSMVVQNRAQKRGSLAQMIATVAGDNLGLVEAASRVAMAAPAATQRVIGKDNAQKTFAKLGEISNHKIPTPTPTLRAGPGAPKRAAKTQSDTRHVSPAASPTTATTPNKQVLYFPACGSRLFGAQKTDYDLKPAPKAMIDLLKRAKFDVVQLKNAQGSCCGQTFSSKGFPRQAEQTLHRLEDDFTRTKPVPDTPIVTDMSTCALHLKALDMDIADSVEFLLASVMGELKVHRQIDHLAIHHNCSAQRLKEQDSVNALSDMIAQNTHVLSSVTCCGFAGDKGMFHPDLNAHALRFAHDDVPPECNIGISTVATCATGLSDQLNIPFVSLVSLLEYCTRPSH